MKKTLFHALALLALISSCSTRKYHVEGEITNAKDSILYFENLSLEGPVVMDSVKLAEDGKFTFAADAKEAPEFYRLRIADQIINLSADSTETVTVKAKYPDMAWKYDVSGSENCKKIQELAYLQIALQNRCIQIDRNTGLSAKTAGDSIDKIIEAYKENIKANYITKEPMKAYAYFALFQAIGNRLIFNPRENRDDIKMFAAVATSWDTFYPEAERGRNLHNIAIEGMKTMRIVDNASRTIEIDPGKVTETNMIDIALLDNKGDVRKLSGLKGNVVILDFHAFSMKGSTERIMELRNLYNKYHAQGLEVYQVGVDGNAHFWKTNVAALPWVCVYDEKGNATTTYNVQNIPTFFLLDRNGTPVKRDIQIKDIEAEIQALLKGAAQ
ncbi:MAG: AhpC/TSA family protein [Bacteroidales bacterium]|nr:AhpC/TSA family protein [Bacteroidales bacterium]MCM1146802.1 AhpC/TSA family protein [Bacteroidales bacterium]MCM1205700.1 AhpC/TSA family protein [Bacillota bacterium]MCM1510770.1 AhpC/TSA family protein [Clostridium sp.]